MVKPTFELSLQKLEAAVNQLEEGSLTLEESLACFEDGIQWSRQCQQFLETAEKRVEIILKNEKGEHQQTEFTLNES